MPCHTRYICMVHLQCQVSYTSDVRNRFFISVQFRFLFLKKNSDSVQNEFGSVQLKNVVQLGYHSYLLLM